MITLSHSWLVGGTGYSFLSFHTLLQKEEKSLPPSAPALTPDWEFLKTQDSWLGERVWAKLHLQLERGGRW